MKEGIEEKAIAGRIDDPGPDPLRKYLRSIRRPVPEFLEEGSGTV